VSDEYGKTFARANNEWLEYETSSIDLATAYVTSTNKHLVVALDAYGAHYEIKVAEQLYLTNAR
jgi:hypothetical protein